MRTGTFAAVAVLSTLAIGCGGGNGSRLQHPTLDQDYADRFVGAWDGTATLAIRGQPTQTATGTQRVGRTGFNRLAVAQVCPGVDGPAGLDSATTFSMDPVVCPAVNQSCGPVTLRWESGIGNLAQDTLTMTLEGTASGCGQSLAFTVTFTGRLLGGPDGGAPDGGAPDGGAPDGGAPDGGPPDAGPTDHGPPSAVVASKRVAATIGLPVILDASGSTDPDGRPMTFAWTIASRPPGAAPIMTGADTSTPTLTAMVEGPYVLSVMVTASDGQNADAAVSVFAHQPIAAGQSFVHLLSDPGDWVGSGGSYDYTKADAQMTVNSVDGHLSLFIDGDENWNGDFQMPSGFARFEPGTYEGLQRYPSHDPLRGGLDWFGQGYGCNTLTGSFTVGSVTYTSGTLIAIDLRFEQHCYGGAPALHGQVHWDATDNAQPPGPIPPPADLWQPAPGSTPTAGNYIYLQSDPGDYVDAGGTFTYTAADALISVSPGGNQLSVRVNGDQNWFGDFQAMSSIAQLELGYYGNLRRYPFHNPVRGGLDWFGEGRGCNTLTGWFVVDKVTYTSGTLSALDLRFEQHCEGNVPALHGQIHWDASDTTQPPGPIQPPPGLWQPAPGSTPTVGNYIYLQSDPGDYIGQGKTFTYTPADTTIWVSPAGNGLSVGVGLSWNGDFQAMSSIAELQPGYYGKLQRFPFHNPARGGLSWYGEGRGCNTLTGWFVVDSVTYTSGTLGAFDLRFEQHCEGDLAALHGQIHWTATGN